MAAVLTIRQRTPVLGAVAAANLLISRRSAAGSGEYLEAAAGC
jgi:hypothetical protein